MQRLQRDFHDRKHCLNLEDNFTQKTSAANKNRNKDPCLWKVTYISSKRRQTPTKQQFVITYYQIQQSPQLHHHQKFRAFSVVYNIVEEQFPDNLNNRSTCQGFHNAAREPHAVRARHWYGSRKLPFKKRYVVLYAHETDGERCSERFYKERGFVVCFVTWKFFTVRSC